MVYLWDIDISTVDNRSTLAWKGIFNKPIQVKSYNYRLEIWMEFAVDLLRLSKWNTAKNAA